MTVDYTKQGKQINLTPDQQKQIKALSFVFTALPLLFFVAGVAIIVTDFFQMGGDKYILGGAFIGMAVLEIIMWKLIIKKEIIKKAEAQNEIK